MWRGHRPQLCAYAITMLGEYEESRSPAKFRRMAVNTKVWENCPDTMHQAFNVHWTDALNQGEPMTVPSWMGMPEFHSAHRAILLAKNFEYYSQWNWEEKPAVKSADGKYPYIWPV